ncbi:hypothetical protein K435DRAFT_866425 [Dendrothele bispora CBS 962.96]|uniref:Uncharacterized protein n=1 Tax=Dendrothele bispora (strain CBS 962.96) TaxID=1314807 RepID=A0A4S8LGX9_DENBC|nr:hypothetical protein K435DRAFT_866425 [Dendrothele bispora CBS 962.96]
MRERLAIWDDDELFYIDRARWRASQARRLEREEASDAKFRKQMDEMQVLADERRKAGLLLDGAQTRAQSLRLRPQPPRKLEAPVNPKRRQYSVKKRKKRKRQRRGERYPWTSALWRQERS